MKIKLKGKNKDQCPMTLSIRQRVPYWQSKLEAQIHRLTSGQDSTRLYLYKYCKNVCIFMHLIRNAIFITQIITEIMFHKNSQLKLKSKVATERKLQLPTSNDLCTTARLLLNHKLYMFEK